MERMLITGLLMVTLTFWGLQAAPPLPELLEDAHLFWGFDALDQNPVATKDTLPPSSQKGQSIHRISTDDGQQKVELEVKNGDITRLAIDGREIPPAEYDQYEDLTEKLLKTPPPAPPAPPAPLSPLSPMAPPAPPAPWGMSPGAAVAPFIFNGGGKVYIDKNGKDGTVIQLNNGGKPTEIVVKDGVVTIDGEPVQEGDSHQIHGQHFFNWEDQSRQPFIFQHGDGRHFEFRSDGNGIAVFPEGNFEFDFEMPEIDINMEHLNESMEHLQERMEELRHQMPEVPEFHFETPHPDIHVPIPPIPPVAKGLHPHSFQQALLNELRRDHLVTDPDNYSVELSAKKLKVNGKRQPANMHQKYLALYKRHTGRELSGDDVFKVSYKL